VVLRSGAAGRLGGRGACDVPAALQRADGPAGRVLPRTIRRCLRDLADAGGGVASSEGGGGGLVDPELDQLRGRRLLLLLLLVNNNILFLVYGFTVTGSTVTGFSGHGFHRDRIFRTRC